ncbi:MAG: response regulator [Patescibacteria group bacterium]
MIEDDVNQAQLYGAKFRLESYDFISAEGGESGCKMAREQKPDVILLDIILFNEDGMQVLREIKQNIKTESIPVIVFSNLDKKEVVDEALKLGAVDYIIKSKVVPAQIVEKVATLTGK